MCVSNWSYRCDVYTFVSEHGYLGCFTDDEDCRVMDIVKRSTTMDVTYCIEFCIYEAIINEQDYRHAGLQVK